MKRLPWLSLLLVAGCSGGNEYPGEGPDMPVADPLPPRPIMERPPSFHFKDLQEGKEYFLRLYESGAIRMEIVTVREGSLPERGATPEEKEYALATFVQDWKNRGEKEHLRFHRDVYENEKWRDATLLDLEMREATAALAQLKEHRDNALFNLRARTETGVTPDTGHHEPGSGFLKKRVVELEKQVRLAGARIEMLRYAQLLRDRTVSRSTQENWTRKTLPVGDILRYWSAEELMARIRKEIAPESWANSRASMNPAGSYLVVSQRAWILREIESHLPNLRAKAVTSP